jgi:hypothetical protein
VMGLWWGDGGNAALAAGASTWLVGTLWAVLLGWQKTVTRRAIRIGWALSPPLAMLNAALACGWLFAFGPPSHLTNSFLGGAILGATFGALVWVPALALTLLFFGVPLRSAQTRAKKGLAGEERGEWIVGLACAAVGFGALAVSASASTEVDLLISAWLGVAGLATGGSAAALAAARARRRRRFVADAEAGNVPGYRIDATEEGKVLVRIVAEGRGYRVADFEEDVFELDPQGEAVRAASRSVR